MFQIGERILLTLWVGGMWTVGYIVAPVLFKTLDDRMLAGNLAGQMFTVMSYIGLFCAVFLIGGQCLQSFAINNWRLWTLLVMLVIVVIGQFVLQPMMAELKAAGLSGETAKQFGQLHGVASILFMVNSLAGLALVITGLSPAAE
ncbi:MAG: DUF4149 domain-containing protein [Gammaproteobacteria bacterium]|jgi:hypothetical protein